MATKILLKLASFTVLTDQEEKGLPSSFEIIFQPESGVYTFKNGLLNLTLNQDLLLEIVSFLTTNQRLIVGGPTFKEEKTEKQSFSKFKPGLSKNKPSGGKIKEEPSTTPP